MDSSDNGKEIRGEALLDLQDYIFNNFKKLPDGLHDVKFIFVNGGFRRPVLPIQDQEYVRKLLEKIISPLTSGENNTWTCTVTIGMEGSRLTGSIGSEWPNPHYKN